MFCDLKRHFFIAVAIYRKLSFKGVARGGRDA